MDKKNKKNCARARTLKAISIEQIFAFFMRLDSTFSTANSLSGKAPQQAFALETVRWRRRAPNDKVVRRRRGNWINERLQSLLIHVLFLLHTNRNLSLMILKSLLTINLIFQHILSRLFINQSINHLFESGDMAHTQALTHTHTIHNFYCCFYFPFNLILTCMSYLLSLFI